MVFTTNLTGYQETFTDPSYLGQIVVMTAPMIGNYGITPTDDESERPQVSGVIVRELSAHYSNWQATRSLADWLDEAGVPALTEVDTRRLTRHIRERGAMRGLIAEGLEPSDALRAELLASPSMTGLDLASRASTPTEYAAGEGDGPLVVAVDYGMKRNIVRMLVATGFRVRVVPATTTAEAILAHRPDGLFLSNGPGDPAAVGYACETIRQVAETGLPTFGICLGHQLFGLAFGGRTIKMPYGHRGGNHPVKELDNGPGADHHAESRLCRRGRPGWHSGCTGPRGDPCQPQRRDRRGDPAPVTPPLCGPVPPRGGPRSPRRLSPLRRLPRRRNLLTDNT